MVNETTNGENTAEQEKGPAPAGKKKAFAPVSADWKYNPKTPLNYRPKGEQIPFMETLIRAKGSQNVALEHCVIIAMGKPVPAAAQPDQSKLIAELRQEIKTLRAAPPAVKEVIKEVPKDLKLDDDHKVAIGKIIAKKNLSIDDAIRYAIKYTAKNDWL